MSKEWTRYPAPDGRVRSCCDALKQSRATRHIGTRLHDHWCSQVAGHKGYHKCWWCGHEWALNDGEQLRVTLEAALDGNGKRKGKARGKHPDAGQEGHVPTVRARDRARGGQRGRVAARGVREGKGGGAGRGTR